MAVSSGFMEKFLPLPVFSMEKWPVKQKLKLAVVLRAENIVSQKSNAKPSVAHIHLDDMLYRFVVNTA